MNKQASDEPTGGVWEHRYVVEVWKQTETEPRIVKTGLPFRAAHAKSLHDVADTIKIALAIRILQDRPIGDSVILSQGTVFRKLRRVTNGETERPAPPREPGERYR